MQCALHALATHRLSGACPAAGFFIGGRAVGKQSCYVRPKRKRQEQLTVRRYALTALLSVYHRQRNHTMRCTRRQQPPYPLRCRLAVWAAVAGELWR